MKITAYPLSDQAVAIEPAPSEPATTTAADLTKSMAGSPAWVVRCPSAVEITWNGGPAPEDIAIRIEAPAADVPAFVQSQLGAGLLTFSAGYQIKTGGEQRLWVRGPINRPKDGLHPLEQIVETALLPCTIHVTWQCTRPHQTIRFEAGEPFGAILPYAGSTPESVTLDVVALDADDDLDGYEQALQQLADSAAVQHVFQRLDATAAKAPPLLGIVFSRDRAMQLDATLRSFYLHCADADEIRLVVIYTTTDRRHAGQYAQLAQAYAADGKVRFVAESDFREDVLRLLAARGPHGRAEHLLFLVDDNVFVRGFGSPRSARPWPIILRRWAFRYVWARMSPIATPSMKHRLFLLLLRCAARSAALTGPPRGATFSIRSKSPARCSVSTSWRPDPGAQHAQSFCPARAHARRSTRPNLRPHRSQIG